METFDLVQSIFSAKPALRAYFGFYKELTKNTSKLIPWENADGTVEDD
ncbi:hypothetical protein [Algoriphagus winogradskyi]|nr:hypothetical protein [Algoriphagus winogradskyi]